MVATNEPHVVQRLRRVRRLGWTYAASVVTPMLLWLACSSSSATSERHEVSHDGHPEAHELLGDMDAPAWAAPLEQPWPRWTHAARGRPTVIRFGYEPFAEQDRFDINAQRISRLEAQRDGASVSYVRRIREARIRIVDLNDDGGIATAEVYFERDDARIHSGDDEAREDSPVAGKRYLCHVAGNRIHVEQVAPEAKTVEESRERILVWRAVRPVVRGQRLAQALAARPQPVDKPLELSFSHLAPLVGADRHWYTESVETRFLGSATVDEQEAAVLHLEVHARVAGQGGTIQTVELTGNVALDKRSGFPLRTELSFATHVESASIDTSVASTHADVFGEHRVRTQTAFRRAPE